MYCMARDRLEQKSTIEQLFEATFELVERFREVINHEELANFFLLVQTTKKIEISSSNSYSLKFEYSGQKIILKDLRVFQDIY